MTGELTFAVSPLLPMAWLIGAAVLGVLFLAAMWWTRARGAAWRTVAVLGLLAALFNPTAVVEERRPLPGVALVVGDDSPSQGIGQRRARTGTLPAPLQDPAWPQKGSEPRVGPRGGHPKARRAR